MYCKGTISKVIVTKNKGKFAKTTESPFENCCPHQGGPVCYGEILGQVEAVLNDKKQIVSERFSEENFNLICPWHGWTYDALTGECIGDRNIRLKSWKVVIKQDQVFLQVPATSGS